MAIGGTYTQLVLFDATSINDEKWSDKVKDLSKIPSSCKFYIFYGEKNTIVEQSLQSGMNPQVYLYKSSDPVIQMFDNLYSACFSCSYILVVSDKNELYAHNLNRITKKHKHIDVMPMDPCNVNITDIIHKVSYQTDKESVKASQFNLQQHSEKEHDLQTHQNTYQLEHLKKISNNKNSRAGDGYAKDLYCLVCPKYFRTKDDKNKHIKAGHPDAASDDDYDSHDDDYFDN
jgi:hypothetical protein